VCRYEFERRRSWFVWRHYPSIHLASWESPYSNGEPPEEKARPLSLHQPRLSRFKCIKFHSSCIWNHTDVCSVCTNVRVASSRIWTCFWSGWKTVKMKLCSIKCCGGGRGRGTNLILKIEHYFHSSVGAVEV